MKRLHTITGTKNLIVNTLVTTTLLFLGATLILVSVECFSNVEALNSAF